MPIAATGDVTAGLHRPLARAHARAGRIRPPFHGRERARVPRTRRDPDLRKERRSSTPTRRASCSTGSSPPSSRSSSRLDRQHRHRLLDPRRRALPRQRLLPARVARRRLPHRSRPRSSTLDGARPAASARARSPTKPRGLVLVTGPTGSGKSTTLAAMIDQINRTRSEHILTIEDPIEFLHAAPALHRQPARDRLRHDVASPRRSAPRSARTRT